MYISMESEKDFDHWMKLATVSIRFYNGGGRYLFSSDSTLFHKPTN